VAWRLADGGRPHGRKGTVMAGADGGDAGAAVAVIGAGIRGSAMTRNLVAAGLTTRVWDRSASATGPLAMRARWSRRRRRTRSRVRRW
jgi:UDP-N-acetylmuramoylalanine-D-glutamate ligase